MRFLLLSLFSLTACQSAADRGEALFSDKTVAQSASNQLTCALCHDVLPMRPNSPGHPLAGVFSRPSFWGKTVLDPLDATNVCVVAFMGGNGFRRGDSDGDALAAYLGRISQPALTPAGLDQAQPYTVPDTISAGTLAALPPGDSGRGTIVWQNACHLCHGDAGTGKGRLTSETSVVPNSIVDNEDFPDGATKRTVVVEKIRHGKFFGIGGRMAPFALERLDDQSVADLLAYFEKLGLPAN